MAALRLDLIGRYLRPHRRTVLLGAIALVLVNVLRVTIPMEVRSVVDELQEGFSYAGVLRQAGWVVLLASTMGGSDWPRANSSSGWVDRWKWTYASACSSTCSARNRIGSRARAAAR